jgi:Ser/Thr protein kinase RdoA (MazF antagonist)
MHPLVDDLDAAAHDSGLPPDEARRLAACLHEVADLAGPLYASLPQQVTHGDFAFGNLLMQGGVVTGYLDFEHSGWDVRAMDLAVGLFRWPPHAEVAMSRCEEFGRAYCARLPLDVVEIAALPALMRLRAGVSFAHWTGRRRAGLATPEDTLRRARRALHLDDWVRRNGGSLVALALGWVDGVEV